jgi:hypothetical protein
LALGLIAGLSRAETLPIPNASFESPQTAFADPRVDAWQETPKPFWFEETPQNQWDFLTGVFLNTAPGSVDHIDNVDGNQALFLFAVPEAGLFQDYDSTNWANPTPTHAFDARFEVGKGYRLIVGLMGAGPIAQGATLMIGLYYRDAASNRVAVAATHILYTNAVFTNATHFLDFQVDVPPVRAADAWANQHIGVQMLSTVDPSLANGYWDIDNVRLTSYREPVLSGAGLTDGRFTFTLEGEPGTRFKIVGSPDPGLPTAEWASVGFVTNETGRVSFTDPTPLTSRRFYRAQQQP